jgi:hypothetical protein
MSAKVEKVYRTHTKPNRAGTGPSKYHPGRTVASRKATNFEIMRDTLAAKGVIKIRFYLQLNTTKNNYLGANGKALIFAANSVEAAEKFIKDFRDAVPQIAQKSGVVLLKTKSTTKES